MGQHHLDFSEDAVPTSERHNPYAHADFDWGQLFDEADGLLEQTKGTLSAHDFQAMGEALALILTALLGGANNAQRQWCEAVGRRTIALAFSLDPALLHGIKAQQLAAELQVSKSNLYERAADIEEFIRRHPLRKPKVVAKPIGDGLPSNDENQNAENLPDDVGAGTPDGQERAHCPPGSPHGGDHA